MKLIKKYDLGGLMTFQPLPLVNPNIPEQSQQTQTQSTSSKKESNIDEALIKQLVGKGITNDVFAFQQEIDNAYNKYESLSDLEKNTAYGRSLRKTMSGNNPAIINALLRNQEALSRGLDNVKTNKAQSSFAVSKDGIAVMDKETQEVKIIDYKNLTDNINKYEMISNTNLANQREINPYLSNTTTAFVALNDAVSIDNVRDSILGYLDGLGSTTISNKSNRFTNGKDASIYNAIQGLSDAVNGNYEQTFDTSKKSNKEQIENALTAIFLYLPDNQKNLLRAEAIAKGYRGKDIDDAAKTFIGAIASSKSIDDVSASMTIGILDPDKIAGTSGKTTKMDERGFEQLITGNNGTPLTDMRLNIGNNYTYLPVGANYFNTWFTTQGSVSKPMMIQDLDNFSAVVDINNVTAGDVDVSPEEFSQVMYPGGKVINALMYIKEENGKIKPDLDLTNRIEIAQKEINQEKATGLRAQQIYRSHDIDTTIRGKEVVPIGAQREFIIMDAIINENMADKGKNKSLYIKDDSKQLSNVYEKNYEYEFGEPTDSKKRKQDSYRRYLSKDPVLKTKLFALKSGDTTASLLSEKKGIKVNPNLSTFEAKQKESQIIGQTRIAPIMENPNKKIVAVSRDYLN